jgi:altronate hydrolase
MPGLPVFPCMTHSAFLKIHPSDNVWVALRDLPAGTVAPDGVITKETIPQKHKFTAAALSSGVAVVMYGVKIGEAKEDLPPGTRLSTENLRHATTPPGLRGHYQWSPPDVGAWRERSFLGYHRPDGRVGTQNLWLVIPLVFCENRNIATLQAALEAALGYHRPSPQMLDIQLLVEKWRNGADAEALTQTDILTAQKQALPQRVFPHVDGIRFLTHEGGCGGIRQDSETLCRLLAGYIAHPNVAGATVLSLGCQNAQIAILEKALADLYPSHGKPVYILEQQKSRSERTFLAEAAKMTFIGLTKANQLRRQPAPISKICLGLKCGGSDGFSGISANPALGHASDLLVASGGSALLAEFPELNGVEQELINRCQTDVDAERFRGLMQAYAAQVRAVGSDFAFNPSPGNIRDGLITDAMKSAGAAKKGGNSPIAKVLDYAEPALPTGLQLLCTPGNDVESTTGLAGSGANVIVFTTGLGTPTGNPVAPMIKMSSNNDLASRMADIIDFSAGDIIEGRETVAENGERLLDFILRVASGEIVPKATELGQFDFIPWKRGFSL